MPRPVLRLESVSKSFGMTAALSAMSIDLDPGEVHAVVGENGAGKSTMIKIMTGVHHPDTGRVVIDGAAVTLAGPRDAASRGIAAIYQEPMVFPDLDVAENIFIGTPGTGLIQNRRALRQRAAALLSRLGVRLDPDRPASGLTVAEQQAVEVARALSQDVRVLIMDEPTAALSALEATQLHAVARKLAADGVAVVYITHRLEEIFEIADRVTVMRDGAHISTRPVGDVTSAGMIAEMVGREVDTLHAKAPSTAREDAILSVRELERDGVFQAITFDVHAGEVVCIAGLIGARRTDVGLALFGIEPATGGTIVYKGARQVIDSPRTAMDLGIAYVSEDRRKFGLAMDMPVAANITLATLQRFLSPLGLLDRRREAQTAERFVRRLNIRTPDTASPVGRLSGGNQQKTMLAKWLNTEPELLIFDEPTRGIDVGAKAEVHSLIQSFVARGGAALVISSDLLEVLGLGDRIVVMREGRQTGILDHAEASQERIMALATGRQAEADAPS